MCVWYVFEVCVVCVVSVFYVCLCVFFSCECLFVFVFEFIERSSNPHKAHT